jgi:hypothetical protein
MPEWVQAEAPWAATALDVCAPLYGGETDLRWTVSHLPGQMGRWFAIERKGRLRVRVYPGEADALHAKYFPKERRQGREELLVVSTRAVAELARNPDRFAQFLTETCESNLRSR